MEELNQEIERILKHLDRERWIAFSKDDSSTTFKAKDKLRAYGLIERHGKLSWQLTKEGYNALELGGYNNWLKAQQQNGFWQNTKNFFNNFLRYLVIPIIVGVIIWEITESKNSDIQKTKHDSSILSTSKKNSPKDSIVKDENKKTHKDDTNKFYLQSYSPVEIFNGALIITLNNTIDAVNGEIELKLVEKITSKTEIASKKKVGDIIIFGNYIISILSLERNISTYDLIVKIETKK
jgi:hypothetical protein